LIALYLLAGFRWLLSEISKDHVNLSRRIEKDVAEQVNIKTNWFWLKNMYFNKIELTSCYVVNIMSPKIIN